MDSEGGNRKDVTVNVNLIDILDYVGNSVRPIREGCAMFEAKHVIFIGYTENSADYVYITGFVRHSSHPQHPQHTIDLQITANVSGWALKFSCKAGTVRCKHIIACLLEVNRSGNCEFLSCSTAVQAWGITKKEKFNKWGAKRISQLCCIKQYVRLLPPDIQLQNNILAESFNRILNGKQKA
ncbi:uncharacterized protein LOC131687863 [Topomyia yanbarensis]|uniref:uncharacterized protein LOC131687863 n=1 Tax=Topomyia yanbarensis TaxID=2498891 RepID=UPI00273B71B8|nr:uncharacterized protein LOC131687863 [Topomyia yanbarensis]